MSNETPTWLAFLDAEQAYDQALHTLPDGTATDASRAAYRAHSVWGDR